MTEALQEIGLNGNPLFGANQMLQQAEMARVTGKKRTIAEEVLFTMHTRKLLGDSLAGEISRRVKETGKPLWEALLATETQKIRSNAEKHANGNKTFRIPIQEIRARFGKIGEGRIGREELDIFLDTFLEDLLEWDWW